MPLWLSVANSLIALGSAAFGVLALIRPEALNGPGAPGGLKAPSGSGNNGEALAGRGGFADVVAAVANRLKGMAFGAAFAALVHAAALATVL